MNWLNIKLASLRAPEYVGSDPTARATWWNVVAYCAEQENGGKIIGARKWKDRQWQQTCGVMIGEVDSAAQLLVWEGDDLLVWNYPVEKEAEIKTKREAGKVGGNRSGEARAKDSLAVNGSSASSNGSSSASTEGEEEGEGNSKRKGKKARARDGFDSLPAELDTAEFRAAWESFIAYRKSAKIKALEPESIVLQWKKMKTWGVLAAINQIEESIANGWQGIFAPKSGATFKPVTPPRPPVAYDAYAPL